MKPFRLGKYLCLEALVSTPPVQEYRAVDTSESVFRGFYKLKIAHLEAASDLQAERGLVFEAKITQELLHPNIVGLYDAGKLDGRTFIAEEYVWGRSLLQFFRKLRDGRRLMNAKYAAYIAAEILKGLNHAHGVQLSWAGNRPVVHQSLNPRNVILSFDGSVKVNDFGIRPVKVADAQVGAHDFRRLGYLSPEQAQAKSVDLRTDVFSTGVLLYEMLTGFPAFLDKTGAKVLERIRNNAFTSPREGSISVPPALASIVVKAMAGDRGRRYQSGLEMVTDLEAFLKDSSRSDCGEGLSVLLKKLFLPEIKKEIVTYFELDKSGAAEGGAMFKTVPVVLFNMVKQGTRKEETEASGTQMAIAPTVPAIKRAAAVVDVEDEGTALTVDHLARSRTTRSSASVVTATFTDEETRLLVDSTDASIFEDEKTMVIGAEASEFDDDATVLVDEYGAGYFNDEETALIDNDEPLPVEPGDTGADRQRAGSGEQSPRPAPRRPVSASRRTATGYYEPVDQEEARAALEAAREREHLNAVAPSASNTVLALIVGAVVLMIILLVFVVVKS